MVDMKKILSDFDDADPNAGSSGDKITVQGTHKVEIVSAVVKESDQYSATFLIVEFKVLETNTDLVKEGSVYGWAHDLTNKWFGRANAKQWLAACCGIDPKSEEAKSLDSNAFIEAVGEEQPMAGEVVMLQTIPKVAKKSGNEFTQHDWSPVGAESEEAAE